MGAEPIRGSLLNATEAATRLGVTTARFRRAAQANNTSPVQREYWKYGRWISYYRAVDVDSLADWLVMDAAARHVDAAAKRPEAARKAAETRRRNAAQKNSARAQLAACLSIDVAGAPDIVRIVTAMSLAFGWHLGHFKRFRYDTGVTDMAKLFMQARFTKDEQVLLQSQWYDRATQAVPGLVKASVIERENHLYPGSLCGPIPHISAMVSEAEASALLRSDPGFVEESQRKERERLVLAEADRVAEKAHSVLITKSMLAANDPGPEAHPTDILPYALTGLMVLGHRDHPLVRSAMSRLDQDTREHIWSARNALPCHSFVDEELEHQLLVRLQRADDSLSVYNCARRFKNQRLNEMQRHGVKTVGGLVVFSELRDLLARDPTLAARWAEQDAAERRQREEKLLQRAQQRQAKAERRQQKLRGW